MGRLGDDYYLIAHDEHTGRLRVSARTAGIGAATALLAELIVDGHLVLRDGGLFPRFGRPSPADRFLRQVLGQVSLPRCDRDVGAWLRFLAVEAVEDLRDRLTADGLVAPVPRRTWAFARRTAHLPTDLNAAAWPAIRLANALSRGEALTLPDLLLAELVRVTGLTDDVLWLRPDHLPGRERVTWLRAGLPPALAELAAHAEAAVGDGVLARRGI